MIVKYISIGVNVLALFISIFSVIRYLVKNIGLKGSELVAKLIALIPSYVTKAEQIFGRGNGTAKKSYVMQALEMLALKEGYSVDTGTLDQAVENVIAATKNVNTIIVEEANHE